MDFTLESSAFPHMQEIPKVHTCDDVDVSPPLEWHDVPENTQSLVLVVDDPDAPDPEAPKMTWLHWLVYNLPGNTTELPAATTSETLPEGALQGVNDWKRTKYNGPCPPIGRHRYFFKLYALNTTLPAKRKMTKAELLTAMQGHILAQAELVGTYER